MTKSIHHTASEVYQIVKEFSDEDLDKISCAVAAFLGRSFGFGGKRIMPAESSSKVRSFGDGKTRCLAKTKNKSQ